MTNDVVKLEKPIYLGQAVLDLSKLIMHHWHYNQLPLALEPNTAAAASLDVVAGDTDSFFIHVEGMNCLKFETNLCKLGFLDTSNFDAAHPVYKW